MIQVLLWVFILALAVWLASMVSHTSREIRLARRRAQIARDKERRLRELLTRLEEEEDALVRDLREMEEGITGAQRSIETAQHDLKQRDLKGRPRLLVLGGRRRLEDQDWVALLVNTGYPRGEQAHPLADEWREGRRYLVWGKDEIDVRERIQRRFAARPGTVIRALEPLPPGILTAPLATPSKA